MDEMEFTCVPVQERLAPEHRRKVLGDPLEHLLDRSTVAREGYSHLEPLRRNIAHRGLDIVRDPLDEVRGVLVLNVQHLLINFFGGHAASEEGCGRQVATMPGVCRTHHVLGVKHLLRQLGHCESAVLLRTARSERREARHEEVEARKGNEIDSDLPQVAVQLAGKAQTTCDTAHSRTDKMVEVPVGWC